MEQIEKIQELFGLIAKLNDMEELFRINDKYVSDWDMANIRAAIGRMRRKIHKEARVEHGIDVFDLLRQHLEREMPNGKVL